MKTLFVSLAAVVSVASASNVLAQSTQEDWAEVTRNAVGDRFMVERNSIEFRDGAVWYWEHRSFPQPNNALLEVELDQPIYSALLYRSVDCVGGVSRLRQITVYNKGREEIHRISYGDTGPLTQPEPGSSAAAVLDFVCEQAQSEPSVSQ